MTIGEGVTTIDYGAFEGCTALKSIVIPESVTAIYYEAFRGCTALTSIEFENPAGWVTSDMFGENQTNIPSDQLADAMTAAEYFTDIYSENNWRRAE